MSRDSKLAMENAVRCFDEIKTAVPHLESKYSTTDKYFDLILEFPKQQGLDFEVSLNLQNIDELHLCAGALWVEWFPCTEMNVVEEYKGLVIGLLNGDLRIVEFYKGKGAVRAELQKPEGDQWATVATWSRLHFPFPAKRTTNILQNGKSD